MKTNELYTVYMSVPESAGRNVYNDNIIEVFVDKRDAEKLADDIRVLVANNWKIDSKSNLNDLVMRSVEVITLEEALSKYVIDLDFYD